jgi:hypothetical protein
MKSIPIRRPSRFQVVAYEDLLYIASYYRWLTTKPRATLPGNCPLTGRPKDHLTYWRDASYRAHICLAYHFLGEAAKRRVSRLP